MKKAEECQNIEDIREAIDHIDHSIVKMIASRTAYVHKAAEFKKSEESVKDPDRVSRVINSKKELARTYGASPELIGKLYQMMIEFFVSEEMSEWKSL